MERIGFTASEEMSFEKVERQQTTDGQRMPTYTISSPMSLRLRRANNIQITYIHTYILVHVATSQTTCMFKYLTIYLPIYLPAYLRAHICAYSATYIYTYVPVSLSILKSSCLPACLQTILIFYILLSRKSKKNFN